jgi:hypothetical protein
MALSNYTELQDAIKSWMARVDSNFSGAIPDMVRIAESRIWKNLRCSDMVSTPVALLIPPDQNWVDLPADWLEFVRIRVAGSTENLNYVPMSTLDQLMADGSPGDPGVYSTPPASVVSIPCTYYQHPGFLADTTTSWLLTKYPDVYLFGALWAACVFSKNSAKAEEFNQLFTGAIDGIESSDGAAKISGGRLRRRGPGLT